MIIIGYPGVGKTIASNQFTNVIDFNSANIAKPKITSSGSATLTIQRDSDLTVDTKDLEKDTYCNLAESLSRQGYVVCVSSHEFVTKYFIKSKEEVYTCSPDKAMKTRWIQMLRRRYIEDDSVENYNAYLRAVDHFDEDIDKLDNMGFENIKLTEGIYLSNILTPLHTPEVNPAEPINEPEPECAIDPEAVEEESKPKKKKSKKDKE